jgi:hypothetical protein
MIEVDDIFSFALNKKSRKFLDLLKIQQSKLLNYANKKECSSLEI